MAKKQAKTEGGKLKEAAQPAAKSATARRSLSDIDTTGLTPEQIADLAEQTAGAGKRKPRNKVSPETAKGSKNTEKDPANVKSQKKTTNKPRGEAPANPVGRPPMFNQALADTICARMAAGESLRKICRDSNMPNAGTVCRWLSENVEFSKQYRVASEARADAMFEEMLVIADDGTNDTYEDGDGNQRVDHDHIARSKLRVHTRQWMIGKMKPKVYGDRVDVNHGIQPENPLASLLAQINGTALPVIKDSADD